MDHVLLQQEGDVSPDSEALEGDNVRVFQSTHHQSLLDEILHQKQTSII